MTIRFFLLQNRQGRTRLSKWWVAVDESDKRKIESEVHRLVTSRDNKFTNFVEVRGSPLVITSRAPHKRARAHARPLLSRSFARIRSSTAATQASFFPSASCVAAADVSRTRARTPAPPHGRPRTPAQDITDNELSYVEAIHCFVEMLDRYFGNVCELDLVFNFHKAYTILDEFILAGELQESSQAVMLDRLKELEKIMMV